MTILDHQILERQLSSLVSDSTSFDLSLHVTPCRFRFLDTHAFAHSQVLRMFETSSLPTTHRFATISYPWKGLESLTPPPQGTFQVAGDEHGGPISIDVLVTACLGALQDNCPLLWFDRLGILQLSCEDKNWEVQGMHSVFSRCAVCVALLGGVQRLAGLEEETPWARRVWTLQEALVPPVTRCVFRWTMGPGIKMRNPVVDLIMSELEPGQSAMTELSMLLGWTMLSRASYKDVNGAKHFVNIRIIQGQESAVLRCAMYILDKMGRYCALWRCAIMRTSSRPVDMVFSIMDLFGVSLDPNKFSGNEREKATIALAREIMKNGGNADWLGLVFELEPARFMSTMPAFPETSVDVDVLIVTTSKGRENVRDVLDLNWYLVDAPTGSVDDKGFLRFSGKARQIRELSMVRGEARASDPDYIVASRARMQSANDLRRVWVDVISETEGAPAISTYAIVIGMKKPYWHAEASKHFYPDEVVVMIVEKIKNSHGFHRIAFALLAANIVQSWEEQEFSVGGPEVL